MTASRLGCSPELIRPDDVIGGVSLALCDTPEYYRRIPDPLPLMAKPLAFLHETPEMLENLGRLLSSLQLGRTMTVLDFGGTCWLSRYLVQLPSQWAVPHEENSIDAHIGAAGVL